MKGMTGISGRLFSSLGDSEVNILAIAQGSSERNISLVIENKDKKKSFEHHSQNIYRIGDFL